MIRTALSSLIVGLILPVVASAQSVFINEIHYDNVSTDTNEAVEVAGPAGTSLAGWSLVSYNGNGGASYATYPLSGGTITNTCAGFGAVSVATPGIQNGAPDGVALVNSLNQVVQFLSYEGTMIATSGPAMGLQSVDIVLIEDGTEPTTSSLHLIGTGTVYPDFTWTEATASAGACNPGQTFVGGVDSPPAVFASTPSDGALGISPYVDLSITFTEDVATDPDWYELVCATSGTVTAVATGGLRNFAINPDITLFPGEACTLTISASAVTDLLCPHQSHGSGRDDRVYRRNRRPAYSCADSASQRCNGRLRNEQCRGHLQRARGTDGRGLRPDVYFECDAPVCSFRRTLGLHVESKRRPGLSGDVHAHRVRRRSPGHRWHAHRSHCQHHDRLWHRTVHC